MSMSARYSLVKEVLEKYPVSGTPKDLFIEYLFIDIFEEFTKIIELGAGTGNWAVLVDTLTKSNLSFQQFYKPKRHFYEVENFNYKTNSMMDHVYKDFKWPADKDNLLEHVYNASLDLSRKKIKTTFYFDDINELLKRNFKNKFHVIRLDCDIENYDQFWKWIYQNTKNRFIVIIDDISPNYCPERFYSVMQEVYNRGILKPIWYGINSGIWGNFDSTKTQELILEKVQHLYDHIRVRNGVLITR